MIPTKATTPRYVGASTNVLFLQVTFRNLYAIDYCKNKTVSRADFDLVWKGLDSSTKKVSRSIAGYT